MEASWSGSDYELTIEFVNAGQVEQAFANLMNERALTDFWMDRQRTVPFHTCDCDLSRRAVFERGNW